MTLQGVGSGWRLGFAALLLAGCAGTGAPPSPRMVFPGFQPGVVTTDPVRSSAFSTEALLSVPSRMHGRPELAAEVVSRYEFLSVAFSQSNYQYASPLASLRLVEARPELRSAIGIRADAAPQAVADAFWDAAAKLARGDRAAAEAALPPAVLALPPGEVLARLDRVPDVPAAGLAASMAAGAIKSLDQRDPFLRLGRRF